MLKTTSSIAKNIKPNRFLPTALNRGECPTPTNKKEYSTSTIDISPSVYIGVSPPFSILGGFKLKDSIIKASDDFVTRSPLRQAITNIISKEGDVSEVIWRESVGAVELGVGASGSVPVVELPFGLGLSVDYGFDPSSLLSYRHTRPARIYFGEEKESAFTEPLAAFPLTLADTKDMPIGREVEICGTGKLQIRGGLSVSEGAGVMGVAKIGIGAHLAAAQTLQGEYALSVMALDGQNQIRLTIRKTNINMEEVGAHLRAGVLSILSVPLPSFGQGAIPALCQTGTSALIGLGATTFASITASIQKGISHKSDVICCYDLDRSKKGAHEAFSALLRLNPALADTWLEKEDSGITKVCLREEEEKEIGAKNFRALNMQLYGTEEYSIRRDGMLNSNNGKILYRDRIHTDITDSIFTGRRKLDWEGITVKDNKGLLHTYYRFVYERHNKIPQQSYVDRHFGLAKQLGITSVAKENSRLIEMSDFIKLFSSADDVTASIELYFTKEGTTRIQNADAKAGLLAFLKANRGGDYIEAAVEEANALLEEYQKLDQNRWIKIGNSSDMLEIITKYEEQFPGRNFEKDLELFIKAQEFGTFIGRFNKPNDSISAREFFALLGDASFDYTEVLGALNIIAGRENLKIHKLCLSGGEVSLKSRDEGQIMHPRHGINMLPGATLENRIAYF